MQYLLLALLAFLGAMDLFIVLDVPLLRQVTGFLFLTFVPGLLILSLFPVAGLNWLTRLLLAVGVSIVFLLLYGSVLNAVSLGVGFNEPLTEVPIVVGLNLFILLFVAACRSRWNTSLIELPLPRLQPFDKAALLPALLLPLAGTAGVVWVNMGGDSLPLLIFFVGIVGYVGVTALLYKRISGSGYAGMLLLVGLSLTLLLAFRGNHLIGTDTHFEYYTFMNTLDAGYWAIFDNSLLDSCLSVSIFPTIYHAVLSVPPEPLFKVLFPVLFSCSPLIVFQISRQYVADHFAYLAGFFYISQLFFIWVASNARTSMAVLFFMLTLLVIFDQRIPQKSRLLLASAFLVGIVLSHYATSFIVLGTLAFVGAVAFAFSSRSRENTVVTSLLPFIMAGAIVFWYGIVTVKPLINAVNFAQSSIKSIASMFAGQSVRGTDVQSAFGADIADKGAAHVIQFLGTWITLGCIAIGLIFLIRRFWLTTFRNGASELPGYLKRDFTVTYLAFAFSAASLISVMVVVPYLSKGYEIARVYPLALTTLSVLFVIGGVLLVSTGSLLISRIKALQQGGAPRESILRLKGELKFSSKSWQRTERIALVVLILILAPYFLSTVGAVHNLLGTPREITMNNFGVQYEEKYLIDPDVGAAGWVKDHLQPKSQFYADRHGGYPLISVGHISPFQIEGINEAPRTEGYVFARQPDWKDGVLDLVLQWKDDPQGTKRVIGQVYSNGQIEILTLGKTT